MLLPAKYELNVRQTLTFKPAQLQAALTYSTHNTTTSETDMGRPELSTYTQNIQVISAEKSLIILAVSRIHFDISLNSVNMCPYNQIYISITHWLYVTNIKVKSLK